MDRLKKAVTPVLLVPTALLGVHFLAPRLWMDGIESAYILIGIPILVLNIWAWFAPDVLVKLLGLENGWDNQE
jgi:hypothetical protein